MKKIENLFHKVVSFIFIIFSTGAIEGHSLVAGLLQFAKGSTLDDISVYHCGKTIATQKHTNGLPKITYEIPKSNEETVFYMLICPTAPNYSLKKPLHSEEQQNTIEYLKIDPKTPYLLYCFTLEHNSSAENQQSAYRWQITEETLPETGQIPDSAIIVIYFPSFIKSVKGGNHLEFPTVLIDNSTKDMFGSDEEFEDASIKLQLSSLDLNALHAPTRRKIRADDRRLLIMDTLV